MGGSAPSIVAEWIAQKRHYLLRRDGQKWLYAQPHGDGRRWDVLDAGYSKVLEIPAAKGDAAVERVIAMELDGSLERLRTERDRERDTARLSVARFQANEFDAGLYRQARDAEMQPGPSSYDGMDRPAIPMRRETHRLLRAVAIRRAKKIPGGGEVPSIGDVFEEIVERHRSELEREAGALYKRELAKKR